MKKVLLVLLGLVFTLSTNAISIVWNYVYPYEDDYATFVPQYVYDIARNDSGVYTIRHLTDTVTWMEKIQITRLSDAGTFLTSHYILPGAGFSGFSKYNRSLIGLESTGSVLALIQYESVATQSAKIFRINGNLSGPEVNVTTLSVPGYYYKVNFLNIDGTNFIITGSRTSSAGKKDVFVRKYNSSGTLLWETIIAASASFATNVNDIQIKNGSIYIGGSSDTTGNISQFMICKISKSTGIVIWNYKKIDMTQTSNCNHVAINSADEAIGCGSRTAFSDNDQRWLIIKLNSSGALTWSKNYNSTLYPLSKDDAYCVKFDNSNNVYVFGLTDTIAENGDGAMQTNSQLRIAKFNSVGTQLWQKKYPVTFIGTEFSIRKILVRKNGPSDFYVFNNWHCYGVGSFSTILRINNAGTYSILNTAPMISEVATVTGTDIIYTCGFVRTEDPGSGDDKYWTQKTNKINMSFARLNNNNDNSANHIQLSPNPASTSFSILPEGGENIEGLMIYDINGSLLSSFENVPSQIDVSGLKSGVYTLKIKVNGIYLNHKIVINN